MQRAPHKNRHCRKVVHRPKKLTSQIWIHDTSRVMMLIIVRRRMGRESMYIVRLLSASDRNGLIKTTPPSQRAGDLGYLPERKNELLIGVIVLD